MCTTETPLVTNYTILYVLQIQSRAQAREQQPKWLYLAKRPPVLQMKMGYQIDDKTLLDLRWHLRICRRYVVNETSK